MGLCATPAMASRSCDGTAGASPLAAQCARPLYRLPGGAAATQQALATVRSSCYGPVSATPAAMSRSCDGPAAVSPAAARCPRPLCHLPGGSMAAQPQQCIS
ncbi:hypothetical protein BS78_K340000 [Paspalum vaginatum]|uniref:Uncharacterized protein n=1 Tax=Paspalum vaginatum TaxID=158149 RepID=A0A9W8CDG3_9POAL|nr:hypothetical protein BS78_K340000 [Paspalum vaginatum]